MGKYSSDSENEKRGSKSSYKSKNRRRISNIRRSSSSDSNESRVSKRRKDKKTDRHRSRSKSRDRYKSRRSRSGSNSTYKSSKSKSYKSDSRYRHSPSRDRYHRSHSKDRYLSRRSRSKSYIREYTSKTKKHSSSSRSSSSDSSSDKSRRSGKQTVSKHSSINKSGLEVKKNLEKSPDCVIIEHKVLDEINADKFAPKQFSSSRNRKVPDNIVIDLKKQTIKVPEVEPVEPDSIFYHNLFLNEEARMEKWVKELYSYRQKSLQQGLKNYH